MSVPSIDFLLTPDGPSARQAKIKLATEAPGLYRICGTWPELMAQVASAYLLTPDTDGWLEKMRPAAAELKDAFWAKSLTVASRETISELDAALRRLLEAAGPNSDLSKIVQEIPVQSRVHHRLSDLCKLVDAIDGLPGAIQEMANFLVSKQAPLRSIRVYFVDRLMHFNRWQLAVLEKLNEDAQAPDPHMQSILDRALSPNKTSNPSLLATRSLYNQTAKAPSTIDGVRVLSVRDCLAEAEITAGLIQNALANGSRVTELGLLLPNESLSQLAVEDVFNRCGLPLSGFHRSIGQGDLGREMLRAFLLCLRKPAPIMAIAALLTSPILPCPLEQGHAMAQAVMDGDVLLKSTRVPSAVRKLMALLDESVSTPHDLKRHLEQINTMLFHQEMYADHIQRANETINHLQAALSAMTNLDWDSLLNMVAPESLIKAAPANFWQEAIPVFHEGTMPWCKVSHLFVLGFNDGHFPGGAGTSAVFSDAEWDQLAAAGLPVMTNDLIRKRQRVTFAEQLSSASQTLTLLYASRDAGGKAIEPSSSLVFIARSLGVEPETMVMNVDRSEDIQKIPDLPLAKSAPPSWPRELAVNDIELGVDLLETFGRNDGELAPLSPSAADTIMVSPFAWLLGRLGCSPKSWGTDDFDVLKAGTLAHRVFEEIFKANIPPPTEKYITAQVPKILRERVLQIAPFLRSPDWRVERLKFESEILRAAIHWSKLLMSCKASIVATEQWLRGNHQDVPLHGQSDLLLQLPSGKLLVVDYKKSSSKKRHDRMTSGFDLQAHLYRLMIQTGGLPELDSTPDNIGIVYYMLNDTTALADSPVGADGSTPGWEELSTDISSKAMQHLDSRLEQIRRGTVKLNTIKDEDWWSNNASLPIYALDNSPLLRLFMRVEEVAS